MSLKDINNPSSVKAAVAEYRRIGQSAFLKKYGFRPAREYFLVIDGERFDSKAILGAAHGYEFPRQGPLKNDQFSGGAATVSPKLQELGFTVHEGLARTTHNHRSLSTLLTPDAIYTRKELKQLLKTKDATINTGIFRPSKFASVLIFITNKKTPDRTPYKDRMRGNVLHCQGQNSGRTDKLLIEHKQRNLELLVFYRDSKFEFPGAGFCFKGRFNYISHSGKSPANFILRRESGLERAAKSAQESGAFDPSDVDDAREKTLAAIVRRQGQPAFRRALLRAYGGRCAVTGCDIADVLEAAHIVPYKGPKTNHVTNGLLLRADFHTLFDLGLVTVDDQARTVIISPKLRDTEYGRWHGKALRLPRMKGERPSSLALRAHRKDSDVS